MSSSFYCHLLSAFFFILSHYLSQPSARCSKLLCCAMCLTLYDSDVFGSLNVLQRSLLALKMCKTTDPQGKVGTLLVSSYCLSIYMVLRCKIQATFIVLEILALNSEQNLKCWKTRVQRLLTFLQRH
jgi:hypothetical protein